MRSLLKALEGVANRPPLVGVQVGGVVIVQDDALIGLSIQGRFDVVADADARSVDSPFIEDPGEQPWVLVGHPAGSEQRVIQKQPNRWWCHIHCIGRAHSAHNEVFVGPVRIGGIRDGVSTDAARTVAVVDVARHNEIKSKGSIGHARHTSEQHISKYLKRVGIRRAVVVQGGDLRTLIEELHVDNAVKPVQGITSNIGNVAGDRRQIQRTQRIRQRGNLNLVLRVVQLQCRIPKQ